MDGGVGQTLGQGQEPVHSFTYTLSHLRGEGLEEGRARVVGQAREGQQHVAQLLRVEGGEEREGVVPVMRASMVGGWMDGGQQLLRCYGRWRPVWCGGFYLTAARRGRARARGRWRRGARGRRRLRPATWARRAGAAGSRRPVLVGGCGGGLVSQFVRRPSPAVAIVTHQQPREKCGGDGRLGPTVAAALGAREEVEHDRQLVGVQQLHAALLAPAAALVAAARVGGGRVAVHAFVWCGVVWVVVSLGVVYTLNPYESIQRTP